MTNLLSKALRVLPLLLIVCAHSLFGATVFDDFVYTTGLPLSGQGGAVNGWSGNWGAAGGTTARIIPSNPSTNLTYGGGGYNITQTGTGHVVGDFGTTFRGINRPIATAMSGTIWFSVLVQNADAGDFTGILLNHNAPLDYEQGTNPIVGLIGTNIRATNGTGTFTDATNAYALSATHLIVGRITVGAGADALSIWMDPTNLSTLTSSTPNLSVTDWDIGSTLTEFGIFSYSTASTIQGTHGRLDALRISDGNSNAAAAFFAVTGVNLVPEPSRALLGIFGLLMLIIQRRRRF